MIIIIIIISQYSLLYLNIFATWLKVYMKVQHDH